MKTSCYLGSRFLVLGSFLIELDTSRFFHHFLFEKKQLLSHFHKNIFKLASLILYMKKLAHFILFILAIAACKEIYDPPPQAMLEASIEHSNPDITSTPKVSVYGVGQDSIWIYQEQLTTIRLPLTSYNNSSFVILLDSIVDTLTIVHDNIFKYESMESGFYNEQWILNIEHTLNRIDSVVVVDSAVTKNWHENIQLYISTLAASDN